jgi:DNA-directed RNA polymerase I subunit RPA2
MGKTKPVAKKMEYFLATGNVNSRSGLDLRQKSGFSIVAERLNFLRYISHFRSVHRGQFYTEMRTSAVRKLLPDSWGFICPVHTPDGAPCGLLNHLGNTTEVTMKSFDDWRSLRNVMTQIGMLPMDRRTVFTREHIPVILDGRIIGMILDTSGPRIADLLRRLKINGQDAAPNELAHLDIAACVPHDLEIAYVPLNSTFRMVPALWLFTHAARMSRPVYNKASGSQEMIGTYEQAFLTIECPTYPVHKDANAPKLVKPKTISRPEKMSHRELDPMNIFSVVATMTPFSEYNQSPRNMYQCQMGKQTMGTPLHNFEPRADNKLFRIFTPQSPIVQTKGQYKFQLDQYAHGTNAVIAVLSYTGYDMEDAMVINKSAYDRGFGHGLVYKAETIDLSEKGNKRDDKLCYFHNLKEDGTLFNDRLDSDGLPSVRLLSRCPVILGRDLTLKFCLFCPVW